MKCEFCAHIVYQWGFEYWCEIGKPKCRRCEDPTWKDK